MQFTTVLLPLFAALAAAQNSTSTSPVAAVSGSVTVSASASATATDASLPDLVSQLPQCAVSCLSTAANAAGCAATDFTCLCGSGKDKFTSSMIGCIGFGSGCSSDDINKASDLAPQICEEATSDPDPTEVASASNIVASAVSTASASSTADAAVRPEMGMGLLGAGLLAALAL
ncbi:hypothetical protein F5X96DRAFT_119786 [Biscogniauxia mediterranea]|nr:hypothetical protein F5X96DRAFT_119786 [Biscogniauxia mediterranea]